MTDSAWAENQCRSCSASRSGRQKRARGNRRRMDGVVAWFDGQIAIADTGMDAEKRDGNSRQAWPPGPGTSSDGI